MKKLRTPSLHVVGILLLLLPSIAFAKEHITWLEAVAPPFFIHKGQFAGQGYEDVVTDIIAENMPNYEHNRIVANISRHYKEFKDGKKACNVGLFKTDERQEFLHFSIPSFFTLPAVLIINTNRYQDFGASKTVSLENVLKNNLVIGRSKHRSYGKLIDNALNTHGNANNIFLYEGPELSLNFFEMLKANRIDGLIGLPEEAMYHAERLGIRDQIMTLTIEENQKGYEGWFSYVACTKNDWGKKVIDQVNQVLREQRPSNRYRGAYERWLDESSLEGYRKLYNSIFLEVK